jgi:hypothetical protein
MVAGSPRDANGPAGEETARYRAVAMRVNQRRTGRAPVRSIVCFQTPDPAVEPDGSTPPGRPAPSEGYLRAKR